MDNKKDIEKEIKRAEVGRNILVAILIIVCACLVTLGVMYGKSYFDKQNSSSKNEYSNNNSSNGEINHNNEENSIEKLSSPLMQELHNMFLTEGDKSAIQISIIPSKESLKQNFENVVQKYGDVEVNYTCVEFSEANYEEIPGREKENLCTKVKLTINKDKSFYYDYAKQELYYGTIPTINKISEKDTAVKNRVYLIGTKYKVILYKDYLIDTARYESGVDSSGIIIYNLNGSKLFEYDEVRTVYYDSSDMISRYDAQSFRELNPIVRDSKLYYIKAIKKNECGCEYAYIDLNQSKLTSTFIKKLPNEDCGCY